MTKMAMINYMIEQGNIDENRRSSFMHKTKDSVAYTYNWCVEFNTKNGSPKDRM